MLTGAIYYYNSNSVAGTAATAYSRSFSGLSCIICQDTPDSKRSLRCIGSIVRDTVDPDADLSQIAVYVIGLEYSDLVRRMIEDALNMGMTVVWFDDHTKSIDLVDSDDTIFENPNLRYIISNDISVVKMAYMYHVIPEEDRGNMENLNFKFVTRQTPNDVFELFNQETMGFEAYRIPHIFNLIDDYERHEYNNFPNLLNIITGLRHNELDPEIADHFWAKLYNESSLNAKENIYIQINEFEKVGEGVNEFLCKKNKYYLAHKAFKSEFEGMKCLVIKINALRYPRLFDLVIDEYDVCISYKDTASGDIEYQLWSNKVDLNEVCKKYNGSCTKNGKYGYFTTKERIIEYTRDDLRDEFPDADEFMDVVLK